MKKLKCILASASPRRKELLNHLGISFSICPSLVEEKSDKVDVVEYVSDLAALKGRDVLKNSSEENPLIIASDTIVVLENKILGKPKNRDEAFDFLRRLAGKKHKVITSIYLGTNDKEIIFCEETLVEFEPIPDWLINRYLELDEFSDKAGAYGIQGAAQLFILNVEGSYSNVVGFPLTRFITELYLFLSIPKGNDFREQFL